MYKLILPALGITTLIIACGSPQAPTSNEFVPIVKTQRVQKVLGKMEKSWPGKIESPYIIDLGFTVPGRVEKVNVVEGQHVDKGEVLATIEKDAAQSARKLAMIEVAKTQDLLNRSKKLRSTGSITEKEYQENQFQHEQALAKAQIAADEEKQTTLTAPYDGIIVSRFLNKGSIVTPGTKVFTFMRSGAMHALIEVHLNDLPHLKIGMEASILLPNKTTITGIVSYISPIVDNNNKTTPVKISFLQQSNNALYPGMFVNVIVKPTPVGQLLIKQTALHINNGNPYVYVVKDSIAEIRKIRLVGHEKIDDYYVVSEGLEENEEVITAGAENISEKQKVKIVN